MVPSLAPHTLSRARSSSEQTWSLSQTTLAAAQSCGAELLDGRRLRLSVGRAESSRSTSWTTNSSRGRVIERRSLTSGQRGTISEQLWFSHGL